ncbi:NTP/NDP exchange transporter [Campylobacter cuniculorum]|uniref:Major facilitator superfamily transporter n=2 Tax=Campylobacter cuniculorum TaxID=374106 RepID=A0A1W6BZF0_9BACT|nr:MFS transporter [Campylobacter cuniculorum]ARJ57452.1 major facilitator superfamily transporter [Campylobacter cuniculorum DSM 23162 = LMG 24588]QOR04886.1 MFS transporter [Campylobacter cuniculorum]
MKNKILQILSVKAEEIKLLLLSFCLIFALFCSYALLRPMRDALGLEGGGEALKWLFLATFIVIIAVSLAMMVLASRVKRKLYVDCVFLFFALNLVLFYGIFSFLDHDSYAFVWLSRIFYVWVSVFNLFIFSTAWSLLSDIFSKERSKRLFGIISAGASLGSIAGASWAGFMSSNLAFLTFCSLMLLGIGIVLKNLMIREIGKNGMDQSLERFEKPIGAQNPFAGFHSIVQSKFLLALCGFVLLLTSVSTFLYMEQARVIKEFFPTREMRVAAFANIDLIVQSASLLIQLFLTARITKIFGITSLLSLLGFCIALGFVALALLHPSFLALVIVMSARRIGEYALIRPGREMLFVPLSADSKYKVKNFIDTVVYRGGDAISAQVEGALAHIGIAFVLFCGAFISFVWGILGVFLGKCYEKEKF